MTDVKDKIDKNSITDDIQHLFNIGLAQVRTVEEYLNDMEDTDTGFINRLKSTFQEKYQELRDEDYRGNELFKEMMHFASHKSHKIELRAAGLAVLCYFFEKCDVFEK